MTSFQTQFKAHFAAARAQLATDFATTDSKAAAEIVEFEKIVGPITGPLSAKTVEDAFERAFEAGAGKNELVSLLSGFVRGTIDFEQVVGPVNDKAQLTEILTEARGEISTMRGQLKGQAAIDEVVSSLPDSIKAGRSAADLKLIGKEVIAYAGAILDEVATRIEAIAKSSDTHRGRAAGLTSLRQASELFRTFRNERKAMEPLKTFDFTSTIELAAKTRKSYPALAAAFDAAKASDLPETITVKNSMGLSFEVDKGDPQELNHAAWTTFADKSATADKVKNALRMSLVALRITAATEPMVLDTTACLAARLGQADLARECNAAAVALSPEHAKDSTAYLEAMASGAEKPIASAAEIAATYPALVAFCEQASFEPPPAPIMLPGVLGMKYEADLNNPDHLNRIVWAAYEAPDDQVTKAELAECRDVAAVGCRISQYTHAAILDTFACLEHRLGNLEVGREAAKRAAEIDPELAQDSAKLYA